MAEGSAIRREGPGASSPGEITRLLVSWRRGNETSFEELLPLVYADLRALAARRLARERPDHTLQPTALVHEAWMRLVEHDPGTVESRSHFFAAAAQVMRRILVEHARRRAADKRGGGATRVALDENHRPTGQTDVDVLDIHHALLAFEKVSPRQARLVELRFFAGLSMREAASVLDVSQATVERDWTAARLWLQRRLRRAGSTDGRGPHVSA